MASMTLTPTATSAGRQMRGERESAHPIPEDLVDDQPGAGWASSASLDHVPAVDRTRCISL
jgi:hypothetical protein